MFAVSFAVFLVLLHQAEYITASVSWPKGTYGLLKPKTGCPKEWKEKLWEQYGWIDQGTVNFKLNLKSKVLNIDGNVYNSSVKRYFCIKNTSRTFDEPPTRLTWPKGLYCIYSDDILDMHSGFIRMNNEKYNPDIYASDSCKDVFVYITDPGEREAFIEVKFSCKTSGNNKIPISLPITKPFYLLPYGSRDCQQVEWMVATSEWIKYHTRNYIGYINDQNYGAVPYHEFGNRKQKGITMYYCYYENCNYTLNDTSGVFQSPGFPVKYPDGQLCSWRIMVPDNHTLHVHFTNFSLYMYDKDSLQFFENNSGIFEPRYALFGNHRPFNITATRGVMFVFRSDEENNSTGFRANYTIFKTPDERTTTASQEPPTPTTHPTTTREPTTKLTTTQQPTTKQPTTKLPTTTEETTTYPPTTNVNMTTNETVQCNQTTAKGRSRDKHSSKSSKETWFSEETWRIVVMVISVAIFLLMVLVIIDIFCRYRYKKALKSGKAVLSVDDGMVINPTYGRGGITIDQSNETVTNEATVDEQRSRDEPFDYEDIDYTQLSEVPPPRRSMKRQECHALQPVGNDSSAVFYHVLEPPKTESQDQRQNRVPKPAGKGTPEVFYHTLEPPTDLSKPTYQNLSEISHCTLNPLYESAENSRPFVEANNMDDHYIA